ncbi:MAG TPA: hypothetical protein P5532_12855 [Planctomycetota bacterium]|nr:hypothetical protein [Planctomycetota bacterium]HRT95310.1 hypothetical protein [Planctomycetota bacterium]
MARARRPKFGTEMIVVDTRESLPLGFLGSAKVGLPTGDYTVAGMEGRVAIERKTLSDLFTCVGRERDRFERELERLAAMERAAVVVEGSLADVRHGVEFSRVHPSSVINSMIGWWARHGIAFWLAGNRRDGRLMVYHMLRHFWQQRQEETHGNGD